MEQWKHTFANEVREIRGDPSSWVTGVHPYCQIEAVLTWLRIGYSKSTHGPMMARNEACCEGCQEPLAIAGVVEKCVAASEQRLIYLFPSYTLENVLGKDCDIKSHISLLISFNKMLLCIIFMHCLYILKA